MYIELYKKYRPKKWEEIIGQETTVESLKSAIRENRLATAYLLQGLAGSGKTSIAKLLTKSLNCPHVDKDLNPCNECSICRSIDEDRQIGFKYISAANSGSAEDVRRIMEESRLSSPLKQKVFIIDECQNLSSAAQDSMLIGLESELQKTIFILCTTNPEKIKPAILSRCQIRNLNKVSTVELAKHLIHIVRTENLTDKVTKENIIKSAENANGSVRNAISNLETIISNGVLNSGDSERFIESIANGDVIEMYNVANEMEDKGNSAISTLEEIYKIFSIILKIKTGVESDINSINELSKKFDGNFILKALSEIGNTLMIVNKGVDSKILLEITLSKLCLMKRKENGN